MTWLRRYAKIILAVYLLALAWALLAPTSDTQSGMVVWLGHVLSRVGAPASLSDFGHLEVVMNVVIIAPVSFFGSLVWPRWKWRDWTAYGFCVSAVVEIIQGLMLSARVAQFSDVVANTGGALVGAVLAHWFWHRHFWSSLRR